MTIWRTSSIDFARRPRRPNKHNRALRCWRAWRRPSQYPVSERPTSIFPGSRRWRRLFTASIGSPSATTTRRFSQTSRCVWDSDDRIALLGANGNGKTTFIKLLAGMLRPMAGEVVKSPRLLVGYFSQQLTEQLDPSASPIESLVRLRPHDTPERMRTYMGRFGLPTTWLWPYWVVVRGRASASRVRANRGQRTACLVVG